MSPKMCSDRDRLRGSVQECLQTIERLADEAKNAVSEEDMPRLSDIDKQLELSFGEKERAMGAYLNHLDEHGCHAIVDPRDYKPNE